MSSTNKTSNYELSQFLGTDKPAWLSDYNTDMSKIDAQMKLNADAATAASGSATSASTAIGTLANLTTDAKTNLVAAVNEVDSHTDSAQSTASSALSASTANATAISSLEDYLNLNVHNTYPQSQFTVISGTGTFQADNNLYISRNAAGTLCKIYGTITLLNSDAGRTRIKLNTNTGLQPDSNIEIVGTGIVTSGAGTTNLNVKINTDGTIEFEGFHAETTVQYRAIACLIFVKNFGDAPQD